jgi:hypothetical protein
MASYTADDDLESGYRLPISTALWGPTIWDAMHFISLGYPEVNPSTEVQQAAFQFLSSLPYLLPCLLCRVHLAETFQGDMPLTMEVCASREALGNYIVALRDYTKQKHACPECEPKVHTFAHDVEARLLGPRRSQKAQACLWSLILLIFLLPLPFLYSKYKSSTGKNGGRS